MTTDTQPPIDQQDGEELFPGAHEWAAAPLTERTLTYEEMTAVVRLRRENSDEGLWNPLTPLDANYSDAEFPVDALPGWMADMVQASAASIEVDPGMPAMAGLGAIATLARGKIRVQEDADHTEPVNLFIATVAPPGERKSAVHNTMLGPIHQIQEDLNTRRAQAIRESTATEYALNAAVKAAKKRVDKAASYEDRTAAQDELSAALMALDAFTPVRHLRLTTNDATPEALVSLLYNNDGAMAIVEAEGQAFEHMAGKYTNSGAYSAYLNGHAGDPIQVDRKGRASEFIKDPALTLVLSVQPHVLLDLGKKEAFRGLGILARFLWAQPRPQAGHRTNDEPPIPGVTRRDYVKGLDDLAVGIDKLTEPVTLTLEPAARREWVKFANETEEKQLPGADLATLKDWANKLAGAVLRIAGLLQIATFGVTEQIIKRDVLLKAISIGRYLIEHTQVAFGTIYNHASPDDAEHILAWATERGKTSVTVTDLTRSIRSWNKDRIMDALQMLVDHGYAKVSTDPRTGKAIQGIDLRPLGDRTLEPLRAAA